MTSEEPAVHARRYRVTGRVQGVFYRASTARVAASLGLRGHARNLPDGSVEVLALGSAAALAALEDFLRRGPPRAAVATVEASDESADSHAALEDFRTG
jgi:acylphosphatase